MQEIAILEEYYRVYQQSGGSVNSNSSPMDNTVHGIDHNINASQVATTRNTRSTLQQ